MRPLTVLLGFMMGTSVALALGLAGVLVIFLILGSDHAQLQSERGPLLRSLALFIPLAAVSAAGFYGELRERRWRRLAQAGIGVMLALAVWAYWPRG